MKKVLIIANLLHASPRIPGLSTYLPKFNWRATIITPPIADDNNGNSLGFPKKFQDQVKIISAPYKGDIFWFWRKMLKLFKFKTNESLVEQLKEYAGLNYRNSIIDKLLYYYQSIFAYPDTEKTWKKTAFKTAYRTIEKESFDLILSSSPFPTTHIVAAKIKKGFNLPWLADFRDPWTGNHNYPYGKIRRYFDKRLEIKTISNADALIAAAPAYAEKQREVYKKDIFVITNGFNPDDLNDKNVTLLKKFTITYTGAIYTGTKGKFLQDPEKFFIALKNLILNKRINSEDVEVRFYGKKLSWIEKMILDKNLQKLVKQYGNISRNESIKKQKESQILWFLNWEDENGKGIYFLKLFEYLSTQRPILATGGLLGSASEKIINETRAGIYAPTVKEIEMALLNFYQEYKKNKKIAHIDNINLIKKYSYYEIAKNLAQILNKIS